MNYKLGDFNVVNIKNLKKTVFVIITLSLATGFFVLNNSQALAVATPVWHASDQKTNNNDSNTPNVDKPSNLNSGDLVIILLHLRERPGTLNNAPNITLPSGFNLIRAEGNTSGNSRAWVLAYYKIAGSNEPANYLFTLPSNINWFAIAGRVTNYNTNDPIGGHSGANSDETNVTSQVVLSFNNQDDNSLLVASLTIRDDESNLSGPSGMSNIYSIVSSTRDLLVRGATQEINSGATGARTFSWTGSDRAAALMFAIKPIEAPTTGSIIITKTTIGGDNTFIFNGEELEEFEIETQNGTGSYTIGNLEPGTYTIQENVPGGWDKTQDTCQNVVVVAGQIASCQINNTKWTTITGIKFEDTNGNGQKDQLEPGLENWEIELRKVNQEPVSNISIDTELVQLSLTGQDGLFNLHTTTSGHYIVTERNQEGWQGTYPVDSFFDVFVELPGQQLNQGSVGRLGNQASTNDPKIPLEFGNFKLITITVQKDVVSPGGNSTQDNHSFKVKLGDESEATFSENSPKVYQNIGPGSYTVLEIAGDPDFDLLSISDDNDNDPSNGTTFNTTSGQNKTIIIVNKQKLGHLIVKKHVDNSHQLGTLDANDFSFKINNGSDMQFIAQEGSLDGQNTIDVNPETYTIVESDNFGYAVGYDNCTSIIIESNQSATCTITNYDLESLKGAVTVIKNLIKNNGGTADVDEFSLTVTPLEGEPISVSSGQVLQLSPGTYAVSESIPENLQNQYTQISISCTDDSSPISGSTIDLQAGHIYQCTITNDDQPANLIIKKIVINDNGGTKTANDFSFKINGGAVISFEADGQNDVLESSGTYTVTETSDSGYLTTYENCSEITLESGQEKTCTIKNDDVQPKLTVTKAVINDNGQNKVVGDFQLFVDQTLITSGVQNSFNAGTYIVSETSQNNYNSSIGGDCALNGSITLNVGDVKSCTITNNDIAQATPNVSGGSSGGGGGGGGSAAVQDFTIISSAGPNGSITPSGSLSVTNGNYTFTITPDTGFSVADVLVDGVSVGPVTIYTFNGVTASHTISASFSQTPQIAGVSTGPVTPSENPPLDDSSSQLPSPVPPPTDSSSGQNVSNVSGEGSTTLDNETEETSTENNEISPETEINNIQSAALSGATGLEIFWNWIKANWPWLLLLIIILLLLYWWWIQNQKGKTNTSK